SDRSFPFIESTARWPLWARRVGPPNRKRNDSFFENAGKLCEAAMMMWANADGICVRTGRSRDAKIVMSQSSARENSASIGTRAEWNQARLSADSGAPWIDLTETQR